MCRFRHNSFVENNVKSNTQLKKGDRRRYLFGGNNEATEENILGRE